jgi:hypothetical protein
MLWIFLPKKSDNFSRVRTHDLLPEASMLTTRPLKPLLLQSDSGAHSSEAFIAEHFECIVCWLCSHQLVADYIHML